jgi:hypothetical protein
MQAPCSNLRLLEAGAGRFYPCDLGDNCARRGRRFAARAAKSASRVAPWTARHPARVWTNRAAATGADRLHRVQRRTAPHRRRGQVAFLAMDLSTAAAAGSPTRLRLRGLRRRLRLYRVVVLPELPRRRAGKVAAIARTIRDRRLQRKAAADNACAASPRAALRASGQRRS